MQELSADRPGAREYGTRAKARDPISGGSVAVLSMVTKYHKGVAEIFYNPPKGILNTMFAIPQGMCSLLHPGSELMYRHARPNCGTS